MRLPHIPYHPATSYVLFIVVVVLLLTRLDFLVNSDFYHEGLVYSDDWFMKYSLIYLLLYQVFIFLLYLPSRDLRFMIFGQSFFWSSTQDLVYFLLWQGYLPNIHQDWWWSNYRLIFGEWNTPLQFFASTIGLTIGISAVVVMTVRGYRPRFK